MRPYSRVSNIVLYISNSSRNVMTSQGRPSYTDKKESKIFLIYKEIQTGSGAKSYMRKGFLIYMDEGIEKDNTSGGGGLPTLPGLNLSTIQPSRRGFYRIHVCEGEDNWRQYILLGAHKLRARRTVCKSVFFFKEINC